MVYPVHPEELEVIEHISEPLGYLSFEQLEIVKKAVKSGEIFLHGMSDKALLFLGENSGFFVLVADKDGNFLKVQIGSFSGLKDDILIEKIFPENIILKRVLKMPKDTVGKVLDDFFAGEFTNEKVAAILK